MNLIRRMRRTPASTSAEIGPRAPSGRLKNAAVVDGSATSKRLASITWGTALVGRMRPLP